MGFFFLIIYPAIKINHCLFDSMASANPPMLSTASDRASIHSANSSKSSISSLSLKKGGEKVSIYSVDSSESVQSKSSVHSVRNIGKKIANAMLSLVEPPLDRDGMLINAPSKRGIVPPSDKGGLYKLDQCRQEEKKR